MHGLLTAIRRGQPREIQSSLEILKRQDLSKNREDIHEALLCSTEAGNAECVRYLLTAEQVDPNITDKSGNPLLYLAVKNNNPNIVLFLCQSGADVNRTGSGNSAPLHLAAKHGLEDCMEILLQFKCKADLIDSTGSTALILAVRWKQYIAISLLLENGCDVNASDSLGRTALHYGCHTAIAVDKLIEAGAAVNIQDKDGCTPLVMAASEGLDRVVSRLCEVSDIDVNIPNHGVLKTPLHILAQKGHAKSVHQLVLKGADINLLDSHSRTPLFYAVMRGRNEVTAMLLKANGLVDTYQCPNDLELENCPVNLAAEKSLITTLKLFILSGFDKEHVRQAVCKQHIQDLFADEMIQHWLDHANDVSSLRHLCRLWLRHHLDVKLFSDLSKLELPDKLKRYILLSELDDILLT